MFKQTTNECEKAYLFYELERVKDNQGKYEEAITFYENLLEINKKIISPNHFDLASSYNNIGLVYEKMDEYSKALSFYECVLNI